MATFFGEVLSVFSRAVEEDEEDEEGEEEEEEDRDILRALEDKRQVRVRWSSPLSPGGGDRPSRCPHLLLAVGHAASRFVSVYLLSRGHWDTVGQVCLWNERTVGSKEAACVLHRDKDNNVLVCPVDCFVAEDQLFQWTEQVMGCVDTTGLQVTVLSDCPAAEYRTAEPLGPAPVLRSLHTSSHKEAPCCPPVEQPNLVTGLPAAVLSFCQLHHISAVLYQCYSDERCPDSSSMEVFRPALTRLAKTLGLDLSPNVDQLRKYISQASVQSNLYI
uniref:Proteasome assembly chaperone 1 n=1 Tax=Neogobius melanostomus TaxID=47308 RepID=A0A8C6S7F2_9GOBI